LVESSRSPVYPYLLIFSVSAMSIVRILKAEIYTYFSFHNQAKLNYIATVLNTFHQQHKLRQQSLLFHRNVAEYWVTVMHFIKSFSNSIFARRLYVSKFFSASPRKFWVSISKGKRPVI